MSLVSPTVGVTTSVSGSDDQEAEPDFEENFRQYFDYYSMTEYLQGLQARFPDLMRLYSLGRTFEGREIWCAKLSDSAAIVDDGDPGSEPDVLIVGAHHGNEWISYETALYVMTFLLENYGSVTGNGSAATYLLDNREVFFVPMLNADGTQYAHDTDRGWRKNREPNYALDNTPGPLRDPDLVPVSYGVDINRNYGWMWHDTGGSNVILSSGSSYRGPPDNKDDDGDAIVQFDIRHGIFPGPDEGVDEDPWDGIDNDGDGKIDEDPAGGFSSAETIAMKELGDTHDFRTAITYHSYSELILWPWGYTHEVPRDGPVMAQLGGRMAEMNGYRPMQGVDLYKVTGEFNDWFYAEYGTFGYTFEIGRTHNIPAEGILNHTRLNLDPALYLIYSAENPYISYLRFRSNMTTVTRDGDVIRVEIPMEDEGYPFALRMEEASLVYRWKGGPWERAGVVLGDDGNLSGSIPVDVDEGKLDFYLELKDDMGNIITEPAYAPLSLVSYHLKLDSIFSLYFGFDTVLVMLFTLGVSWGGFSLGIAKSIRSDRSREGKNG